MGLRSTIFVLALAALQIDFSSAQTYQSSIWGTYGPNPGYSQLADGSGSYNEQMRFRYMGCNTVNLSDATAYPLYERTTLSAAAIAYGVCAGVCWGDADYRDGQGAAKRYANWQFMAISNGTTCFCGNATNTPLVANPNNTCWNATAGSPKLNCVSTGQYCGSAVGAIVFGRADLFGNCTAPNPAISASDGHACNSFLTNRTITLATSASSTSGGWPNVAGNDNSDLPGDAPVTPDPTGPGGTSPNGGCTEAITCDNVLRNGTFNPPFRTANSTSATNVTGELYETTDFRYVGCYASNNTSPMQAKGVNNPLFFQPNINTTNWGRRSCAAACWTDYVDGGDTANIYRNWRYFAVSGGGTYGTRCYCGPLINTAKIDPEFCWGADNTAHHRPCSANASVSCGGDAGAIVFARADLEGTCTTNATGASDHQWFVGI